MVSVDEILMGRAKLQDLTPEIQGNIQILVQRINELCEAYGKPFKVNDGLRLPGQIPKNGAAQSNHFFGLAIDIDDDDAGTLWKWVFANRKLLEKIGLWCEHPCWTHCDGMSWMHFQVVPPKSGRRFYVPSARPNPNPTFWDGKYEASLDSMSQPGII